MSDENRDLQRRLEQATAVGDAADENLDPETAEMRAGWLALGELLEKAQPPEALARPRPSHAASNRRWLVMGAALAASLLVAAAIIWHVAQTMTATGANAPQDDIAENAPAPVEVGREVAAQSTASSDGDLAWDDSFDEEIETAGEAIRQAQRDPFASLLASNQFEDDIERLRRDIEESSL